MSDEDERRRRLIIGASDAIARMSELVRLHMTKIIGYTTAIAGAVAVMDPALVADTLGPDAIRWALLISGVATLARGHTNKLQPAAK